MRRRVGRRSEAWEEDGEGPALVRVENDQIFLVEEEYLFLSLRHGLADGDLDQLPRVRGKLGRADERDARKGRVLQAEVGDGRIEGPG